MQENPGNPSDRLIEETLKNLDAGSTELFEGLSAKGRECIREMVGEIYSGDDSMLEALYAVDYDHKRVDPHTFFTHPDYMGHFKDEVYDAWWPHILRICDPNKPVFEAILTGSLGIGKSTVGSGLIMSYHLHRLLCLKDPASFFGLAKKSKIVLGLYSLDLKSAEDIGFYILRDQLLADSPFFNEVYRRNPYGVDEIKFPKDIVIKTGSQSLHIAGKNLFAIAVDEMNLMKRGDSTTHKAFKLANDVSRRLETRFMQRGGEISGVSIFIGSAGSESDFIENRIRLVSGRKHYYVVRGAKWEYVKTDEDGNSKYSGKKFRVQVGNKFFKSKLLDRVIEEKGDVEVIPEYPHEDEGCDVVDVPVEHYTVFDMDVDGSLRDLAGISTRAFMKLFSNAERVRRCMTKELENPFAQDIVAAYLFGPNELSDLFRKEKICRVKHSHYVPARHPGAPRYIHIDLAKTKDLAGIAMVHPSSHFITVEDDRDVGSYDVRKEVEVDFVVGVSAGPRKEAIDYANIRRLVFMLRRCGFWIRLVTLDSWQSEDSRQRFLEAGIKSEIFSLDKDCVPYLIFRNAVNSGKFRCPKVDLLYTECVDLDYDSIREKVDHPEGGSKDLADGVAGATYRCLVDKIRPAEIGQEFRNAENKEDVKLNSYLSKLDEIRQRMRG